MKKLYIVEFVTEDDKDWSIVVASSEEDAKQEALEELQDTYGVDTIDAVEEFVTIQNVFEYTKVGKYKITCVEE